MADASPLLAATGIVKAYPGVRALDGVGLTINPGEVHALLGENGAGKSTLSRICAGIMPADGGMMLLDGHAYAPLSRCVAEAAGVRMVTQELNLIPTMSIAESIFLDRLPNRFGVINWRRLHALAAAALEDVGLRDLDPRRPVGSLGVGQQQMVEIARGLSGSGICRLLILDEPTAALTSREIDLLFARIACLKAAGGAVLYISHRMEEILRISDQVTILRDGRQVGSFAAAGITLPEIIRHMVGREVSGVSASSRMPGPLALSVRDLAAGPAVRSVSFDLHRGEILGLAGLVGSGRTETLRAIFGADRAESGSIALHGAAAVAIRSPHAAVAQRMAFLTEDRKGQGLLLSHSITRNTVLTDLPRLSLGGQLCRPALERQTAEGLAQRLGLRARDVDQAAGDLSGGNQQKVVIAKWLFRDADILLFDEPTRGIDIGAKSEIYRLLAGLAAEGKAILVVSSDLPELFAICDRISVMSAGRLVETFPGDRFDQEAVMAAALQGYIHV